MSSVHVVAAVATVLLAGCPSRDRKPAQPEAIPAVRVALPLTGLAVDLPGRADRATYKVTGIWELDADDGFYSHDAVEEVASDGETVGLTWVTVGFFDRRPCEALFDDDLAIAFDGPLEIRAFGSATWAVRGGFATSPEVGRLPAVGGCTGPTEGQKLMVWRFLIGQPESMTPEQIIAAFDAPATAAIELAFRTRTAAEVAPAHLAEVENQGEVLPVREIRFSSAGLSLTLPDDGNIWRDPRAVPERGIDVLERVAPAIPFVYIELYRAVGVTCDAWLASSEQGLAQARGVFAPWMPGPTLAGSDDYGEMHMACLDYEHPTFDFNVVDGAVAVGFLGTGGDLSRHRPLLDAIARSLRL